MPSACLLPLQVKAYEIPQIAAAVAELSDTDQIPITYMVVRKRHNTRYGLLCYGGNACISLLLWRHVHCGGKGTQTLADSSEADCTVCWVLMQAVPG